jgi:hypothetical protein
MLSIPKPRVIDLSGQLGPAKVKLGIRNTSDLDLLQLIRASVEQMQDNPNFPNPIPDQDLMREALSDFSASIVEAESLRTAAMAANAKKNTLRAILERLYSQRGSYVALVSNGDPTLIMGGGLATRKDPSPVGQLLAPGNLSCELSNVAGQMIITWNVVRQAQGYLVQRALITPDMADKDFPWEPLPVCTKRKLTLNDLVLGQRYAFRVATIGGKNGQSTWSPAVIRMAA